MIAGGSEEYQKYVRILKVGDKVFPYLSRQGYVGLGVVTAEAVPQHEFIPEGQSKRLIDLPLTATIQVSSDPDRKCDYCASVRWIRAVDRSDAILKDRFRRQTFQPIKQPELVEELLEKFGISENEIREKTAAV